eukprot:1940130-Prymnesium_polylepis.2
MFTARVASEPGGTQCATARKSWYTAPNLLKTFTPPQTPRGPLSAMVALGGVIPARERWIRSDATFTAISGKGRGLTNSSIRGEAAAIQVVPLRAAPCACWYDSSEYSRLHAKRTCLPTRLRPCGSPYFAFQASSPLSFFDNRTDLDPD